jgi:hypothetical protein
VRTILAAGHFSSRAQQLLDRAPLVDRAIPVRDLSERKHEISCIATPAVIADDVAA